MALFRCGPTALSSRSSWGPASSPALEQRPLSANYDRIFNAFERSNAFQFVRADDSQRGVGHGDVVVNRRLSGADCALAAQSPSLDEDEWREKLQYSQARQLFPLQEDLADWINKTVGISHVTGENFLQALDNGAELCQLAAVIHQRAKDAFDSGLIAGPVPAIRGRCWQRAARRSFFSRDNTDNFLTFCRDLGVHENLLFESDDLVLHNQPRQVILCLLEVARLATRYGVEPPGLVALEKEIAAEEHDSGLDSAMSSAAWQFRDLTPPRDKTNTEPPETPDPNDGEQAAVDSADNESTKSEGQASTDSDVPLKPNNELDKRVQLVTRLMERGCQCGAGRCSRMLKVKKVGEGRYNIAGRNVFIRLLKGRHMMVRVGGGWDTLEHFLSRHEPCQVRLVTARREPALTLRASPPLSPPPSPDTAPSPSNTRASPVDTRRSTPNTRASPVDTRRSPGDTKSSPIDTRASPCSTRASSADIRVSPSETSSGKVSPRSSTPNPRGPGARGARAGLTLPLQERARRKQSAPSLSTPGTPVSRGARTPPAAAPKKSRSMSLAGAELRPAGRSSTAPSTPAAGGPARGKKARSASLAENKFRGAALTVEGALTQQAIEDSIRRSLAASLHEPDQPFLHIKAKYRSPPPREVPPR